MSRQFQEADQLRDQLSALGVMVHDREKTWEVKPGFGGAPAAGAYGGNNFGAQPGQYAGKPPADYYSAPTGAGGFSSAPPSLNDMATDAQKRIAAAQQAASELEERNRNERNKMKSTSKPLTKNSKSKSQVNYFVANASTN